MAEALSVDKIISNAFDDLEKIRATIDWFGDWHRQEFFDKKLPIRVVEGPIRKMYVHNGKNILFRIHERNNNTYRTMIPDKQPHYCFLTWEPLKSTEDLLIPIGPLLTSIPVGELRFNENDETPHITIRNIIKSIKEGKIEWSPISPRFQGLVIGDKQPMSENHRRSLAFYQFNNKVSLSKYMKACMKVEDKLRDVLKRTLSKIAAESRSIIPVAVENIIWSYLA
ncbi:MAG: hypothetical protein Harvfovirus37_2 [Harvfovirus sp.]|uniref:Uncharacterized protein n=1 Tax=Harvfovirus sp. TaxID=2487768 RepID=A0A3G5A2N6_9VIRU|nr:MAG: hypothetical protein Harvfovirus37_2 [Harvfovirus sp.]